MKKQSRSLLLRILMILMISGIITIPVKASSANGFKYVHDPIMNCKAMQDIIVNPDAIYGFSPNPDSGSLKGYAKYDWTDTKLVEESRQTRIEYHLQFNSMYELWEKMLNEGASDQEIAIAVCNKRNEIRIESYKDDPEGLAILKQRNLEKYGDENGPSAEFIYNKLNTGSWKDVIYSAFSANSGMDACLGLYDDQYIFNLFNGSIKEHTLDEGTITKKPTATENGVLTRTCSVCGTKLTETIPATGEATSKEKAKIALDSGFVIVPKTNQLIVKWGTVSGATKYLVYGGYCGSKKYKLLKTVSAKTKNVKIQKLNGKKLKNNKSYHIYVVAKNSKGQVIAKSLTGHAAGIKNKKYTNAKSVTLANENVSLDKGNTFKVSARTVLDQSKKIPLQHCNEFRYSTSNKNVATVSGNGTVKALGTGECYIFVYGKNGRSAKVKINVN